LFEQSKIRWGFEIGMEGWRAGERLWESSEVGKEGRGMEREGGKEVTKGGGQWEGRREGNFLWRPLVIQDPSRLSKLRH
jgi:hypothetical protein